MVVPPVAPYGDLRKGIFTDRDTICISNLIYSIHSCGRSGQPKIPFFYVFMFLKQVSYEMDYFERKRKKLVVKEEY